MHLKTLGARRSSGAELHCSPARDERDQPDHQKHEEQNLRDTGGRPSDTTKTQNRSQDGDNQKHQRPMQHVCSPTTLLGPSGAIVRCDTGSEMSSLDSLLTEQPNPASARI